MVSVADVVGKTLPNFGPFAKQKKQLIVDRKAKEDVLGSNVLRWTNRPPYKPQGPPPKVQEVIGKALDAIGTYNDLDNKYCTLLAKEPTKGCHKA